MTNELPCPLNISETRDEQVLLDDNPIVYCENHLNFT